MRGPSFRLLDQGAAGRRADPACVRSSRERRGASADGVADARGRIRDPLHRRSSRGLTLDRAQLPARDRVCAMRRPSRQPSRRAMCGMHRARADGAQRVDPRTGQRSDPSLGHRAWPTPRAITSGRRPAAPLAFGRLIAPAGRARRSSVTPTTSTSTHGTRRSSTPVHSRAFSAGATNRFAPRSPSSGWGLGGRRNRRTCERPGGTGRPRTPCDVATAAWTKPGRRSDRYRTVNASVPQ